MPLTIAVITDGFMLKDTRGITLQENHAIITNCYIKKQKHLVGQMLIIVSLRQLKLCNEQINSALWTAVFKAQIDVYTKPEEKCKTLYSWPKKQN